MEHTIEISYVVCGATRNEEASAGSVAAMIVNVPTFIVIQYILIDCVVVDTL